MIRRADPSDDLTDVAAGGHAIPSGVFIDPDYEITPAVATDNELGGLAFSVKDLFDLKGRVLSAGNPQWARRHPPSSNNAPIVDALLSQGARLKGVTNLDEFAFSLIGENSHFGTPDNPSFPGHFCGGSSCGAAASVASGAVDFALGTDTAGSMRVPASHCGLFSIRPARVSVTTTGIQPLSPSFDTPGWFAKSSTVFQKVTNAIVKASSWVTTSVQLDVRTIERVGAAQAEEIVSVAEKLGEALNLPLAEWRSDAARQEELKAAFVEIELFEAWQTYKNDFQQGSIDTIEDVSSRFERGRKISAASVKRSYARLERVRTEITQQLEQSILVRPTVTCSPLRLDASPSERDAFRSESLLHTALVPTLDWAELVMPLSRETGQAPLGISFCASAGIEPEICAFMTSNCRRSSSQMRDCKSL